MTLIVGARCSDGFVLAADRRRLSKHEKGPSTTKLFQLSCGVALAGAGDDAILNEARILIDRRIKELQDESSIASLFDIVEVTAGIVNDLVSRYQSMIEEPFGFVLSGLNHLNSGNSKLYTVIGAGLSEVPWACLGSGSSYARPLVELLLADGNLSGAAAANVIPTIFTLVSNVQTTVGDGIDVCIIKDEKGLNSILSKKETDLSRLRTAILDSVLKHSG
jgi:20S proteasome alpha/beta subunit